MSPKYEGVIATKTLTDTTVIDGGHPAVCNPGEVVVDGTYVKGQFLSRVTAEGEDQGKLCKYTKENNEFAGVNTSGIDSTLDPISIFMEHGCYVLDKCLVAGAVPDAEDISRAAAKGCWAR